MYLDIIDASFCVYLIQKTINLEPDFQFISEASKFSLLTDMNYGNMFRLQFAVISSVADPSSSLMDLVL